MTQSSCAVSPTVFSQVLVRGVLKDQNYPGCLTYDFVRNFRNICQIIIDHHDQYKRGEQDRPKHPSMYYSDKNINNRAVQDLKASEQSVWCELQYTENRQKQTNNRPKTDQKQNENRPETDQKQTKNRLLFHEKRY